MKGLRRKINISVLFVVPVFLIMTMVTFMNNIRMYNNKTRVNKLVSGNMKDGLYDFGEVAVAVEPRGDEAWNKDSILDDNGNEIHGQSVGTIYEARIYNKSENTIKEWTLKIPIHEKMWINNSWNSSLEIHQDVKGNEKVMTIDVGEYANYDITLDYYVDHTGPMIELNDGDYFVYIPDDIPEECPVKPSKNSEPNVAKFGYIMYVPNQTVDYISDFSGGEIVYKMYANPLEKKTFWIIATLMFIYLVWLLISIIVRVKIRRVLKKQRELRKHDEEMMEQTIKIILNFIDAKDNSTMGHSLRVAEYSKLIAEKMGYSEEDCKKVYYIGLLHDCGKLNVPSAILKNPGKLSDEEYAAMKKHTTYGAEVLKDFTSIKDIDIGAKCHHERYDGHGYPSGLSGEDIPEIARIIGVADAFDAMNSKRCYRDKLPKDVVISELVNNKGKQFDPKIVDLMIALIDEKNISME